MAFRALVLTQQDGATSAATTELEDGDLMPGSVVVDVERSTVNYKDGLAVTGRAPIVRTFPLVPGIDLAGTVASSDDPTWQPGDAVVLNGWGVGESHHGGLAQRARVDGGWLVRRPTALSAHQAMAVGTAGYTAMLCVLALERGGVKPGDGPVVVTGAAGGVGSVAVALLAGLGHEVAASTGRPEEESYLRGLGASAVIPRDELGQPGRPLGKERWAGAVDAVGSTTLANVLATTRYGGVVAACGLAQGNDLPTTVLPFILRGVTLAGIDSVRAAPAVREEAWGRLATDLDLDRLEAMTEVIGLNEVPAAAERILAGQVRGRLVVDVSA